jgi:predicted nucleotidyltransferase
MKIDREHVLAKLREQREHIEREYGLRMIGIVGSVARGEATERSDIDIWVDMVRTPTLFQIAGRNRGVGSYRDRPPCRLRAAGEPASRDAGANGA